MAAKKGILVNLLPREDFERTTLGRIMKWALTSFRLIVIMVEFVVIGGFLFRFWLDLQISNLDDEIIQKSALISSKSSFEGEFRKIQNKLAIYRNITAVENTTLPIFREVVASIPADTQLTSFTRQEGTLSISGITLNEQSISNFIFLLEEKPSFASVVLEQITAGASGPFVEFSLKVSLANIASAGGSDGN